MLAVPFWLQPTRSTAATISTKRPWRTSDFRYRGVNHLVYLWVIRDHPFVLKAIYTYFQDSLLSRFDLLFIVLDLVDVEQDRRIADHVVRMHRYRASCEQDGDPLPLAMNIDLLSTNNPDENDAEQQETPIYEKYDALLHGSSRSKTDKIVSMQFMKKYIHVARALKVWQLFFLRG
jgi:hypothetical protein